MDKKEINAQEQAGRLVAKEILCSVNLTVEKELRDNPDLLFESANFYPQDENGDKDENGDYPEIYEYWAVSKWLGDRLKEQGEIIFEMLDFNVWGRQCTGQAILLDNVIQEIAKQQGF